MVKFQTGVTLVELMIVMVIIGLLMVVAIPSYRDYTVRAHRVDAQSALMSMAAAQEKFYLANGEYCGNTDMSSDLPNGLGIASNSNMGYYEFKVQDSLQDLETGYVMTATAIDGQLSDDADCKVMGINHRGVRYGGPGPVTQTTSNNPKCWGN